MTTAEERVAELKATLAVVELEDKLAKAKKRDGRGNIGAKQYRDLKDKLRQKRMEARALRDGLVVKSVDGRKVAVEADAK